MDVTFPRRIVTKLLDQKCERYEELDNYGREVWIYEDVTIIQLPYGDEIEWEVFQMIAKEQLGMGDWDFDYWLGENI